MHLRKEDLQSDDIRQTIDIRHRQKENKNKTLVPPKISWERVASFICEILHCNHYSSQLYTNPDH